MIRYLVIFFSLLLLVSCEDTNVVMMTDAASDAVTAITLTDEDVRNLAQQAAQASDSTFEIAGAGTGYDQRLRRLVANHSTRDGYTFNFQIYVTKEINAFAMADGTIRVFSGLMDLMNDEELLFVIGHEMGHVVKNHTRKKVVLAYAASALKKGLASQENEIGQIANSVIGSFAEQLTHAQFSQYEERQADQYGAAFLRAEGYDVSSAVSALNKLAALAKRHTFLSSHPEPEARAKRLASGEDSEGNGQDSFLQKLIAYGAKLVLGFLSLLRALLEWLLSWL